MHCQNIVDGRCVQKDFFKNIFAKQSSHPKFCKQINFEPCLDHSLVTTVFDLNLVRVLGTP
jgi:hypothetical protein